MLAIMQRMMQPSESPGNAPPPPPAPPKPPAASDPRNRATSAKSGRGLPVWAGLLLGLVGVVLALSVLPGPPPEKKAAPAAIKPEQPKPKPATVTSEEREAPAKPALEVLSHAYKAGQYNRFIEGRVRNNTGRTYNLAQISIKLLDKSGNVVGSAMDNVNNLGPGEVWKFSAIVTDDSAVRYQIVDVDGF
jgi:hypothetical protein